MNVKLISPPFTMFPYYSSCAIEEENYCNFPGFDFEIVKEILQKLNLSYTFLKSDIYLGSVDDNGKWSEALGLIQNGTIDTAIVAILITEARSQYFDFSYPVRYSHYIFVCKSIQDSFVSRFLSIFKPFSLSAWLGIMATILCLFLTYSWLINASTSDNSLSLKSWTFCTFIKGDIDEGFFSDQYSKTSKIIFLIFTSIFLSIFVSLYQGFMLIGFEHKNYFNVLYTFQDLIYALEKGYINVVIDDQLQGFLEKINRASPNVDRAFYQLQKINNTRPFLYRNNISEIIKMVQTGKYVYPILGERLPYFNKHYCDLSAIYITDHEEWSSFIFKKGSPLVTLFNRIISKSWSVFEFYRNKYANYESVGKSADCPERSSSLSIRNLLGIYVLLSIGGLLGIVVLIIENLMILFKRAHRY